MGLENIGGWELILIILVGLFIFGPDRLPKAISDGVRMLRTLRQMARNATGDLSRELGTQVELEDLNPKTFLRKHLLSEEDERAYRRRFQWLGEEIVALIGEASQDKLRAKPSKGRVLRDIVGHVANAEPEYFRASSIGKPEGVKEALQAIEGARPGALGPTLAHLWKLLDTQLERITPEVRTAQVQRGEKLWTARRGFRRALEHPWEHLREMRRRLA